jgi:hypothetical protein
MAWDAVFLNGPIWERFSKHVVSLTRQQLDIVPSALNRLVAL